MEHSHRRSIRPATGGAGAARVLVALALLLAGLVHAAPAHANPRYAALVRDLATGEVLFARAPHETRHPASLAKMMTLFVLFEEIEARRLALDTPLFVSPEAAAQPAMKLGLAAGESILVEDAIKALVTRSANDVATLVAESVAGTEAAFAERMTRTSATLGMQGTRFTNASGLPDPHQVTTAWDMAVLGAALQVRFPDLYRFFATESFTFRGRTYESHNRVTRDLPGADGLKTGYIRASGFNLVTSVRRDGRKVIAVVMGGRTSATRDAHMIEIVEEHLPRAAVGDGYAGALVAAARPGRGERPHAIEIGAFPTASAALAKLRDVQAAHGGLLEGAAPYLDRNEVGVRARFAGFESRPAALDACATLRAAGLLCRAAPL